MSETMSWSFVGDDRLSALLERIDKLVGSVDRSFEQLGRQSTALARETRKTEDAVDDLGDQMRTTAKDATVLESALKVAETRVGSLQRKFRDTGDTNLLGDIGKAKSEVSKIKSVASDLGDLEKAGKSAGGRFLAGLKEGWQGSEWIGAQIVGSAKAGLSEALSALPSEAKLAITGVAGVLAVSGASLIGATVSAGILAGVGGGALALGVRAAVQDPAVAAEWAGLGEVASAKLADAGRSFKAPVSDAIRGLTQDLQGIDLGGIIRPLAAQVKPLAEGIGGLIKNAVPGFQKLSAAAAPIVGQLARELPAMGASIGRFAGSLSRAAPGAAAALGDVLHVIEGITEGTGVLIEKFSQLYAWGRDNPLTNFVLGAPEKLRETSTAVADLGTRSATTAVEVGALDNAFDRMLTTQLGLKDAGAAYTLGLKQMQEDLRGVKRTLDETNVAGATNVQTVIRQIQLAAQKRQAAIDAENGSAEAVARANKEYLAQIAQIEGILQKLGFTKAEINNLTAAAKAVPDITIRVDYKYAPIKIPTGGMGGEHSGYEGRRPGGGRALAGMAYLVGDAGRPEVFVPDVDGHVYPDAAAWSPGPATADVEVMAPVVLQLEGEQVWQGMLRFKRRSGKATLGLA